jgi:hypothetical protein
VITRRNAGVVSSGVLDAAGVELWIPTRNSAIEFDAALDFFAQKVSAVAIFPCKRMRDAQSEAALAGAMERRM